METTEPYLHGLQRAVCRWVGHLGVLGLIVGLAATQCPDLLPQAQAIAVSERAVTTGLTSRAAPLEVGRLLALDLPTAVQPLPANESDSLHLVGNGDLLKVPQRQTIIPKRPRKELVQHTVKEGENLSTIAALYDVDVDTLIWANDKLEEDPDYLVVGQVLVVPPVSGVLYTVKGGDTLESIAKQFKGDVRTMVELEYNRLLDAATVPMSGTKVLVPGGEKPYQPRLVYIDGKAVMVNAPRGGGRFVWPTMGIITSYYDPTHRGIDIAAPIGTPIYAADSGVVVAAGWMGTYGNAVIIDHGNGFQSLYAHLSAYYPQVGQNVRRGQAIGKMGSTGKSTGPHLHFEITYQGGAVNPMRYLPQ